MLPPFELFWGHHLKLFVHLQRGARRETQANLRFERSARMRSLPLLPAIGTESPLTQRSVHDLHHLDDLLILPPLTNQLYPHRQSFHRISIVTPLLTVKRLVDFFRGGDAAGVCRKPVLG